MEEEPITNSKEIARNSDGTLKKGVVLNPNGRPLGSRDFATDFDEVVDDLAKENKMTKSEVRKLLLKVAYKNAKDGNYSFYKDIHDRIYGTAQDNVHLSGELTSKIIRLDIE